MSKPHGAVIASPIFSGVTRGTAAGDTLQGVTPEGKKLFVGKFTKNTGETRSDR